MKKMTMTLLALSTFNLMACPDLTGKYLCTDSSGDKSVDTISYNAATNTYNFVDETDNQSISYIADGQKHASDLRFSEPMGDIEFNGNNYYNARVEVALLTNQVTCLSDSKIEVISDINFRYLDGSNVVFHHESFENQEVLTMTSEGYISNSHNVTQIGGESNETETCVRIQ